MVPVKGEGGFEGEEKNDLLLITYETLRGEFEGVVRVYIYTYIGGGVCSWELPPFPFTSPLIPTTP